MSVSNFITCSKEPIRQTPEQEDDELSDLEDAQSIPGSSIDPNKLAMLLRIEFGAGAYGIHVRTLDQRSACKKADSS